MKFIVREAVEDDLPQLLELYEQLHPEETFSSNERTEAVWQKILSNKHHVVLMGCIGDRIVSSCHLVIIDNITHANRPYAVIENVITDVRYRGKGGQRSIFRILCHCTYCNLYRNLYPF